MTKRIALVISVLFTGLATIDAQNRLINPSFETAPAGNGPTGIQNDKQVPPWAPARGVEFGRNVWNPVSKQQGALRLYDGGSIEQFGVVPTGRYLLLFTAAGVPDGEAARDAIIKGKAGGLHFIETKFRVPTAAHGTFMRPRYYAWAFDSLPKGNGSSSVSLAVAADESGVVIDDLYLISIRDNVPVRGFAPFNGYTVAGGLEELALNDGKELVAPVGKPGIVGIIVALDAPSAAPAKLALRIHGWSKGSASAKVSHYDFQSGIWDGEPSTLNTLSGRPLGVKAGAVTTYSNLANPSRFVGPHGLVIAHITLNGGSVSEARVDAVTLE
jgi:hypothetical protein